MQTDERFSELHEGGGRCALGGGSVPLLLFL